MAKSKHSEKNKKHGFWKKTLLGVFVVLLLVVAANVFQTQSSLTGYPVAFAGNCTDSDGGANYYAAGRVDRVVSNGTLTTYNDVCVSSTKLKEYYCSGRNVRNTQTTCAGNCNAGACALIGQASGIPPVSLNTLAITIEDRTLTIDGALRNLTLLRLQGANNTLRLENGNQSSFLFIAIHAKETASRPYIGNVIYYNYPANKWKTLSLLLSNASTRYDNTLNATSSRRGMGITYITNNLKEARTSTAQIFVNGLIEGTGSVTGSAFSGSLQVIDGYNATALNSTLGQGGTWNIPFTQNGFGSLYDSYVQYLYYDSTVGPQHNCYGYNCTASYLAAVNVPFRSPASVKLDALSRTLIKLRETTSTINSFKFTCADTDPTDDRFIVGNVSLTNTAWSYVLAANDRCEPTGTNVTANEYACTTGLSDNLDNNGCGTSRNALKISTRKSAYNGALPGTWKEISDSDWNALGPQTTVSVMGSTTSTSTQRQYLEVFSKTQYDDQQDSYVGNGMEAMWRTTFSSPLPMCADTSKSYARCDASDKIDATSAPTTISIFGDPWTVIGVTTAGVSAINSITVGKAYLVRKTLRVGEETAVSGTPFKIRVQQVNAPAGSSSLPSCTIVVSDATNRTVLKTRDRDSPAVKVTEFGDFYVKVSSIAYSAVAGAVNTCEVSAYSSSITLSNGTIDNSLYPNWKAVLSSNNRSSTQGLSDLRIYNDNWVYPSTGNLKAKPGDKFTIINGLTSNAGYALEFRGSNLMPGDFDNFTISEDEGFAATLGGRSYEFAALRFCSQRSDAFRFGTENVRCVTLITKNKTSSPNVGNNYTGYVVYQNSSGTWVNASGSDITRTFHNYTYWAFHNSTRGANLTIGLPLYYYASGGGSDTSVRINVTFDGMSSGKVDCGIRARGCSALMGSANYGWNYTRLIIQIPEVTNESTSRVTGSGIWTAYYHFNTASGSAGNFRDGTADGTTTNKNVNYTSNAFGIVFNSEAPYCGVRGSCVERGGLSASSFTIQYATRLGKATYVLRKIAGTANVTTNATIIQSANCNALTQLPQINNTPVMCTTPRCNAAKTACAP